jgi:hypothetical protein
VTLEQAAMSVIGAGESLVVRAVVDPRDDALVAGGVSLHHRVDGGAFSVIPMTEVAPGVWEASAPGVACLERHEWFVEAVGQQSGGVTAPPGGASEPFVTLVGALEDVLVDDAETDQGWIVSGNATAGAWERGAPVSAGRADPPTDADGSGSAWLTENSLGPDLDGNSDVDGGSVTLESPALDLADGGVIDYAWWLNDIFDGEIGREDTFIVEIATDATGHMWQTVRTHRLTMDGWRSDRIVVGVETPASDAVRVRFTVSDLTPGDVVEAGLDDIRIARLACASSCEADFDGSGVVDASDLSFMLGQWGEVGGADIVPSGAVDAADLSLLLSQFGPCSL